MKKTATENAAYYSSIETQLNDNFINLKNELREILQFNFITDYIHDLESRNMKLSKQIEIIEHVKLLLKGNLKNRYNGIILKNPDYNKLIETVINMKLNDNMKYLTLSTVDVERSFSILRRVLNDRTHKMTKKSINNYMIIRYNKLTEYVEK